MGKNIDKTYIQMKMLNTGKGPAVRALRAQADKALYAMTMKHTVERQENLTLRQSMVDEILVEDGKVVGVRDSHKSKNMELKQLLSQQERLCVVKLS